MYRYVIVFLVLFVASCGDEDVGREYIVDEWGDKIYKPDYVSGGYLNDNTIELFCDYSSRENDIYIQSSNEGTDEVWRNNQRYTLFNQWFETTGVRWTDVEEEAGQGAGSDIAHPNIWRYHCDFKRRPN